MEGKYTGVRYVHSDAEIKARVWYTKKLKDTYIQQENKDTGNREKKYSIKINNFNINLYKNVPNFEKYDTITKTSKLKIFSDFYLPIELFTNEYVEFETVEKKYSYDELKEKIINKLEEEVTKEMDENSNILNKVINENKNENDLEIELTYEVEENIGVDAEVEYKNNIEKSEE
jgi:sporulation protein YqfD